jgi:hypothetical protein
MLEFVGKDFKNNYYSYVQEKRGKDSQKMKRW